MKKIVFILVTAFINVPNVSCQNTRKLSDYFPDIQNENIIMNTGSLWRLNTNNPLDTIITLKYFFDNDTKKMHYVYQAYNMDDNTYADVPYIKMVYPLYKIKKNEFYLLCYNLESIIDLIFYDYKNDKIISVFTIGDDSDEYSNIYTYSIIFPNNYIATIKVTEKVYYILSKIDYEGHKFIELKKVEANRNQSDYAIMNNAFEALGISETGELLEENP
jgi:hypothetical protein